MTFSVKTIPDMLVEAYGNQTEVARRLKCSRGTVRKYVDDKDGKCTPSSTTFSWFIADGVKEMRYYEKIDGSKYRNIWVVGDLHGCYTNLMKKLEAIGFDTKKDLLISVGDLVDRGTENVECLELITFPWFIAVRGNHEQMMIDGLSERGNVNHWLLNGGGWFFNLDYDKEILAKALAHKADELPLIIELVSKDKKYIICHADYPCDEYEFGKPVDHQLVIWNRERISNSQDGIVKEIKGADTFIFGHTPAVKPLKFANQMYIDTGAVFCGNLTLIQVQGEGAWA